MSASRNSICEIRLALFAEKYLLLSLTGDIFAPCHGILLAEPVSIKILKSQASYSFFCRTIPLHHLQISKSRTALSGGFQQCFADSPPNSFSAEVLVYVNGIKPYIIPVQNTYPVPMILPLCHAHTARVSFGMAAYMEGTIFKWVSFVIPFMANSPFSHWSEISV